MLLYNTIFHVLSAFYGITPPIQFLLIFLCLSFLKIHENIKKKRCSFLIALSPILPKKKMWFLIVLSLSCRIFELYPTPLSIVTNINIHSRNLYSYSYGWSTRTRTIWRTKYGWIKSEGAKWCSYKLNSRWNKSSTPTVNSKKLISDVWNDFKRPKIDGNWKVMCNYCEKRLLGDGRQGTSHLQNHFKTCKLRTTRDINKPF